CGNDRQRSSRVIKPFSEFTFTETLLAAELESRQLFAPRPTQHRFRWDMCSMSAAVKKLFLQTFHTGDISRDVYERTSLPSIDKASIRIGGRSSVSKQGGYAEEYKASYLVKSVQGVLVQSQIGDLQKGFKQEVV